MGLDRDKQMNFVEIISNTQSIASGGVSIGRGSSVSGDSIGGKDNSVGTGTF